ncbi:unnamed protein product [Ranitomeya imitator]|uniref:Perilipin n=1 Tax=Ranitomeya imitator TaxID=111125 RepID=A0ABN9LSC3_9NEOB|nr:unnamed protein product [Ranitomeya imitator]
MAAQPNRLQHGIVNYGRIVQVIKMHFGTNLPAGRFGGRTAHAPAILEDGGAREKTDGTTAGSNVVIRLINLPLVSSTYDLVSSAYVTTKDHHPYLKSVCDAAEKSVRSITSVAITGAMPILQKLEPQISVANNMACVGLDKIEEKLPILHQPPGKVVANASEAVVGARDAVVHSITGVVDKTKGAVQDGVEMTRAVVHGSINTVLGSRVVKILSNHVDSALTRSESLMEHYLPPTHEELGEETTKTEGFEMSQGEPGYYLRLGSLSTKVRKRSYQQALTRIKDAKCRSQKAIVHLQSTVSLIHDAQENIYNKWVEWTRGSVEGAAYKVFPQNIQTKVHSVGAMAADVLPKLPLCLFLQRNVCKPFNRNK